MHIHLLGICGTFMGSLALLAKEMGHKVSGSDTNIYPPMSEMLIHEGIDIIQGHHIDDLQVQPDCVVVGNVMKRGMPIIEYLLNEQWPLFSGPEFLAKHILPGRTVIAVAGTHGKTTTASMIAWILEKAGMAPGFLIGGIPNNFGFSARLGTGSFFVVEADEYDCAFFDKRAKFIHYHPNVLVINNIEYDHADIYPDLYSIQQQFHHLIRTLSGQDKIFYLAEDMNIEEMLAKGCWTPCDTFGLEKGTWNRHRVGALQLSMLGAHNMQNAIAALGVTSSLGVELEIAKTALTKFSGVKRRLELKAECNGVRVYEDFAHHPTAIEKTIHAVKQIVDSNNQLVVVIDVNSNTMRSGEHAAKMPVAVEKATQVYFYHQKPVNWNLDECFKQVSKSGGVYTDTESMIKTITADLKSGDVVLCLSNGALANLLQVLILQIQKNGVAIAF